MMSSTIMIVDLDPLTSLGIRTVLSGAAEHTAVEHADNRDRVVARARNGAVDLAIFDPCWPNLDDGLRFCRSLKALESPPYLLALSRLDSRRDLMYCLLAGVDSFVSAFERPERLIATIRTTLTGRREWVFDVRAHHRRNRVDERAGLTPRELEVLWMVRERYTNRQVASSLSISPYTVKNHVAAILRKLGMTRRAELFAEPALG
jgi:DNA-binding NarL/FixJ family response regulator